MSGSTSDKSRTAVTSSNRATATLADTESSANATRCRSADTVVKVAPGSAKSRR